MKKTLYITQETQDRLAKLGGPTPSENLRRAVALAECADELAVTLKAFEQASELWLPIEVSPEHEGEAQALYKIKGKLVDALTNYRIAKQ